MTVSKPAAPFVVAADAAVCQRHFHYLARGVCRASGECQEKIPLLGFGRLPSPDAVFEQVVREARLACL